MENKRKFKRVPADLMILCEISATDEAAAITFPQFRTPVTENLSLGGLMITMSDKMSVGMEMKITLASFSTSLPLEIGGKVVWCKETLSPKGYQYGIQFLEMEQEKRKILAELIENMEEE